MNWLNPQEVGAWLDAEPRHGEASFSPPMTGYALEQFVKAIAETGNATYATSEDVMSSNSQLMVRVGKVARLLVKAMGEK